MDMSYRTDGQFGFEKLDVYQRAIDFVAAAGQIIAELPSGYHAYADQLRRAALSRAGEARRPCSRGE